MKMTNSCYKLKYRFLLVFIVLINIFFLFKKPIYAYTEFNERTIRGTEIIHVGLDDKSNSSTVLNHIKTHINPYYSNSISSTPSYNQEKNGSLYWYIKDSDDDLLAIYFDGGERKGRDNFYDFIELRWLGNGSPHMYCFWKMDSNEQNPLDKKHLIQARHLRDETLNLAQKLTKNKMPSANKLIIKIFKKILSKISKKIPTDGLIGKIILDASVDLTTNALIDQLLSILESNPQALETVSQKIRDIEDIAMNPIQFLDGTLLGDLGSGALDGLKVYNQIIGTPTEVFKKTGKNISEGVNKISNVNNPEDVIIGAGQVVLSPVIGTVEAGKDTVINATLHTIDGLEKIGKGISRLFGF